MQAIEQLNIKQKNWKDLLSDEPFTRKDIVHLQDPLNLTVSASAFLAFLLLHAWQPYSFQLAFRSIHCSDKLLEDTE